MKRKERQEFIVQELDNLFDTVVALSHEVRKVEFGVPVFEEKTTNAIIKNFEKIGTNVLVAHKRAKIAYKKETE